MPAGQRQNNLPRESSCWWTSRPHWKPSSSQSCGVICANGRSGKSKAGSVRGFRSIGAGGEAVRTGLRRVMRVRSAKGAEQSNRRPCFSRPRLGPEGPSQARRSVPAHRRGYGDPENDRLSLRGSHPVSRSSNRARDHRPIGRGHPGELVAPLCVPQGPARSRAVAAGPSRLRARRRGGLGDRPGPAPGSKSG